MFNFIWDTIGGGLGNGVRPTSFFLGELGAGSGANNSIDFTVPVIIKPSLKLVRASAQGASITDVLQTGLDLTGDFTVQAKVNPASLTGDFDLFDKWDGTGNQRSYIIRIVSGGAVYLYASADGAAVGSASVSYQFVVGTEVDVAVKYTAATGTMNLLINGVSVGTATGTLPTSIFNSTAPASIGILSTAGTNAFDGKIKSMYVYSAVLADATVLANVTAATPDATSLVAQWNFNNDLLDETVNNNDLTAINAPTYTRPFSIGWFGYASDEQQRSAICGNQTLVNNGNISFYNTSRFIFIKLGGANTTITQTANFEDQFGYIELKSDDDSLVTAYFNGTSVGSATVTGTFIINRVMGGPNNSASTFGYYGGMHNFKIYVDKLLSTAESTQNQNGGHVSSGCALWYKMNETSGATVIDYSGNSRTGTIDGAGANFFQTVLSTTNVLSNGGLDAWAGTAFPNDLPTGYAEGSAQSATNYFENTGGRAHIFSDGTSLGFTQVAITEGVNYRVIFPISTITTGNIYIYQGAGNNSIASLTPVVGQNIWNFVGGANSQIGPFRMSGGCDVVLDNIQVFRV